MLSRIKTNKNFSRRYSQKRSITRLTSSNDSGQAWQRRKWQQDAWREFQHIFAA